MIVHKSDDWRFCYDYHMISQDLKNRQQSCYEPKLLQIFLLTEIELIKKKNILILDEKQTKMRNIEKSTYCTEKLLKLKLK